MAKYGRIALVSTIFSLNIYYIVDWGIDIAASIDSFRIGEHSKGATTIVTNLIAAYALAFLHAHWNKKDYGKSDWHSLIYILPFALLYQQCRTLALLLPILFYPKMVENIEEKVHSQLLLEDWKSIRLALIQTVLPNFIQVIWHFHPTFEHMHLARDLKGTESAVVVISLVACVMGLSAYHHHRRHIFSLLHEEDSNLSSFFVQILTYLYTGLTLIARMVAVTAAISTNRLSVLIIGIMILHYVASWILIIWQKWDAFHHEKFENRRTEADESDGLQFSLLPVLREEIDELEVILCRWFGKLLLSFILVVTHIEDSFKYSVSLVYLAENVTLIIAWYLSLQERTSWAWQVLAVVIVTNITGVVISFITWRFYLKQDSKTLRPTGTRTEIPTIFIPSLEMEETLPSVTFPHI